MPVQSEPSSAQADTRHVVFLYRHKGREILIGSPFAWLVAIVVIAIVAPSVLAIPAAITAIGKSWRGG